MNNNTIDLSAWIEYFKGNKNYLFIKKLVYNNLIFTNDIILIELLPFIIHRNESKLAELLRSLRKITLSIDWQEIQNIQILNLKYGNNNVGIPNIIVAQNCVQNNLILITKDKHFKAMSKYIPLKLFANYQTQ
ncbi:MAG: PIN domain-containing protein [Clostridiales bacterium]|jgi:predicted nucleic acid-binding protein|nr:PIN domain-containing protein [Clostridiales bacterium]